MVRPQLIAHMGLGLVTAGCTSNVSGFLAVPCPRTETPLEYDEASSLGFSPNDVVEAFGQVHGTVSFDDPALPTVAATIVPRAIVSASETEEPDTSLCFPGHYVGMTMVWDVEFDGHPAVAGEGGADAGWSNWLVAYNMSYMEFSVRSEGQDTWPLGWALTDTESVTYFDVRFASEEDVVGVSVVYNGVDGSGAAVAGRIVHGTLTVQP